MSGEFLDDHGLPIWALFVFALLLSPMWLILLGCMATDHYRHTERLAAIEAGVCPEMVTP